MEAGGAASWEAVSSEAASSDRASVPVTMAGLVRFHADNKLLLLARSERWLRVLGRVVANAERLPPEEVSRRYADGFARAVAAPRRSGGDVDALLHGFGHVSERLSPEERRRFLTSAEAYRTGRTGLDAPLELLRGWATEGGPAWLSRQTFLAGDPADAAASPDGTD